MLDFTAYTPKNISIAKYTSYRAFILLHLSERAKFLVVAILYFFIDNFLPIYQLVTFTFHYGSQTRFEKYLPTIYSDPENEIKQTGIMSPTPRLTGSAAPEDAHLCRNMEESPSCRYIHIL